MFITFAFPLFILAALIETYPVFSMRGVPRGKQVVNVGRPGLSVRGPW